MTNQLDREVLYITKIFAEIEKSRNRDAHRVYMDGNCGNLYYIFREIFPCVQPFGVFEGNDQRPNHIVSHIYEPHSYDQGFYDIKPFYVPTDEEYILPISESYTEECSNNYEANKFAIKNPFRWDTRTISQLEGIDKKFLKQDLEIAAELASQRKLRKLSTPKRTKYFFAKSRINTD